MKKLLFITFSLLINNLIAQHEYSSFTSTGIGCATTFASDYQALGINPANLGWDNKFEGKKFTIGLNEFSYSIHSDVLAKQELRDAFMSVLRNDSAKSFTYDEKLTAAQEFANSGMSMDLDYGSIGFSFATEKFGGIAFRINDQVSWYSKFNKEMSEIMFMGKLAPYFDSLLYVDPSTLDTVQIYNDYGGMSQDSLQNVISGFSSIPQNISSLIDGSNISFSWIREYNLSYGRKVFEVEDKISLYAGIGFKYVQGIGYIDISSENNELTAFSSLSPIFPIDYGSASVSNPSTITQPDGSVFPKSVGNGFGIDLGINLLIADRLKIGLALTNLGSITWDGNVYTVKDTLIYDTESSGLQNYSLFQNLDDIVGDDGLLVWDGIKEKKVKLPSALRIGLSFKIKEISEVGIDVIVPVNDGVSNYEKAIIGIGGDIRPAPWLRLSAGFLTGGNYDFQIPVGITLITANGSWEGGIASRDVITFFTENGPTLSLSTGFLRFRF